MTTEIEFLNTIGRRALRVAEIEGIFAGSGHAGDADRAYGVYYKLIVLASSLELFGHVDHDQRLTHVKRILDDFVSVTYHESRDRWVREAQGSKGSECVPSAARNSLNSSLRLLSDEIDGFLDLFSGRVRARLSRQFGQIREMYGEIPLSDMFVVDSSTDVESATEFAGERELFPEQYEFREVEELDFDNTELTLGRRLLLAEDIRRAAEFEDDEEMPEHFSDGFHVESRKTRSPDSWLWRQPTQDVDWGETTADRAEEDFGQYEPDGWDLEEKDF